MTCIPTPPPCTASPSRSSWTRGAQDTRLEATGDQHGRLLRERGFGGYFCFTRPEGDPQAEACDYLAVGQASDTGRWGPTWTGTASRAREDDDDPGLPEPPGQPVPGDRQGRRQFWACAAPDIPLSPDPDRPGTRCGLCTIVTAAAASSARRLALAARSKRDSFSPPLPRRRPTGASRRRSRTPRGRAAARRASPESACGHHGEERLEVPGWTRSPALRPERPLPEGRPQHREAPVPLGDRPLEGRHRLGIGVTIMMAFIAPSPARRRDVRRHALRSPSFRKIAIAGQALVKADWKRFSPTKAVNRKKPGWTQ